MIVRQLLHADPVVAASYFVACGGKQAAIVIDPVADPRAYLDIAAKTSTRIQYVIDTHVHADHVSTGRALAMVAGARYVLHADVDAGFAFHGVRDGDRLEIGNVLVDVWHVPRHTPEHIALVVTDRTRAIMIAHTLGNPFDLGEVMRVARKYNLLVVEDCCDALGASYDGKGVGTFGDIGTLSFYPAHHITMGEGGAVFTNKPNLKRAIESMRDWGRDCYCAPGMDNTCNKRFGHKLGTLR